MKAAKAATPPASLFSFQGRLFESPIRAPGHHGVHPCLVLDLLAGLLPQQEHGDAGQDARQDAVDQPELAESLGVGDLFMSGPDHYNCTAQAHRN